MQFQIEVISVTAPQTVPTKNGKSYQAVEIAYKKDGKIEGKKILSFTNPTVFKEVQKLSQGDHVTVTAEKNEAGYWQWEAVNKGEVTPSVPQSATAAGGGTTKSTGGTWETKEERAAKQVMIVRQSSLANAVALLAVMGDKKASYTDAINIAQEFEAYVMGYSNAAADSIATFEDDVPL